MSCPTCQEIHCLDQVDTNLYSLEGITYPFVINCPSGYDCNEADGFNIICCGQMFSAVFTPGMTGDQKQVLIDGLVDQCANRLKFCGDFPPDRPNPPPDPPPIQYYYNRTKSCYANCPDGGKFYFTVLPGTFAALTQDQADSQAQSYACQQAALRKICLSNIQSQTCANVAYSQFIIPTGGLGSKTLTIVNGVPPTGLNLNTSTGELSGTPTVGAEYIFTVRAVSTIDGSYTEKDYTICVVDISPSGSTLSSGATGVAFSQTFSATSCATSPLSWQVSSGSLPPGLTLNEETGKLSGIPTTSGTYHFTIHLQSPST